MGFGFDSHAIKREDAVPVKQPPRWVPMAYAEDEKKATESLLAKVGNKAKY